MYSFKSLETVLPKYKEHIMLLVPTHEFFPVTEKYFFSHFDKRPDLQNGAAVFGNECVEVSTLRPQKIIDLSSLSN